MSILYCLNHEFYEEIRKTFTAVVVFYYFPTTILLTMCAKGLSLQKLKSQFAETQEARGRASAKTGDTVANSDPEV